MNKVMNNLLTDAQTSMEQSLARKTLADFIAEIKTPQS